MADTTITFFISFLLSIFQKLLTFHVTCFLLAIPLFAVIKRKCLAKFDKKTEDPLPPGPNPWPVLGCLFHMAMNRPAYRWIHKLMERMNTEIICIRLGRVHVIAVKSPELSREFLKKQDSIFASRPEIMAANVTTRGYKTTALVPWGAQWRKMRKVMATELFSTARHRWFHSKRVEEADHLMRYIYNQCNLNGSGLVNIRLATQQYCGNLIRRMVFDKRFFGKGKEDGGPGFEEEEHVKALFTILDYLYSFCFSDYIPVLRGKLDLDGHEKVMMWTDEIMRKYHDPLVDERIQQWNDGLKKDVEDLLDILISLKDEKDNPLLTPQEIKAQITEIMIATVDNPSNAAEWALAEMINKPEIMQRAVLELDCVVGRERLVQESDFPKLNYVKACAREAFRLHPIAPFNVPHVSMADTMVANYFIPKGSHVLLSRPGLGRNPRVWEDPYTFKPERHLKEGVEVVLTEPDLRFISFSTGRRGCMGVILGTAMTVMLFARLLHAFTWTKPPDVPKIDLSEEKRSMFLAKPLVAVATPRLPAHVYPA